MDKEMTGPAMEALVRACAEAVWQMYREPHNLTWDALKESTFEAVLALLLSTHKPLLERIRELEAEGEKLKSRRVHTQDWYSSHYGKLEDWARTRLPDEWADEFFSCVANGLWGQADLGTPYKAVADCMITPAKYFRMDTAEAQIIRDQTTRAEEAEARAEAAEAKVRDLEAAAGAARAEGIREWFDAQPACCGRPSHVKAMGIYCRTCAMEAEAALISEPKGASK